jgi:hypothetical protein
MESGTMFAAAAVFMIILLLMMAWASYADHEVQRILRSGKKTRVTVVDKQKERKGTTSLQVRLEGVEPFWRIYLAEDWATLKPGDALDYVYEPEFPEAGVLGKPNQGSTLPVCLLIFSVFVAPFLLIGTILKRRERAKKAAASSPEA